MTCMAFDRSKRCLYTGGEAGRGIERLGVPGKSRRPRRLLVLTVCRKGLSNFGISLPDSSGALGTWQAIRHTYSGTEQPLGCSQSFSILGAMICLHYVTVMSLCCFVLHPSFTDLHCTCPLRLRTFTMKQPAEIRSPALELANLTSPNLFFESLASLSIVFALQCFVIATGLLWAKEGPNSFVVGLAWDRRCTDPCIKKTKSAEVCEANAYLFQKLCSRRIYVWPDSRKQIVCYLKTQGTTVEQEAGLIVSFFRDCGVEAQFCMYEVQFRRQRLWNCRPLKSVLERAL